METLIASLALLVSLTTGVWSVRLVREQARAARLANLTSIVTIERSLSEVPSALRFHGISPGELEQAGVTAAELAYLLANCSVTAFHHNNSGEDPRAAFADGSYRHGMCATPDFRRAWPLVRRMMNKGTFVSRIDATIAKIESGLRARRTEELPRAELPP